jgi:uncharacterized membrane protein (DUF4010 family)
VAIAAGVAAGVGQLALASATIAICTLLLVEKSQLHALVGRIDDEELRAAVRFGVMAVVILPLLPEGPYGPLGGIRPRELWLLVLFLTGLSFAAYFVRRLAGAQVGLPIAGLLGGIISSTNVTYTFARASRREPALAQPLAAGMIGACTMLFPRVLAASSVLDVTVATTLVPYFAAPFLIGVAMTALSWRRRVPTERPAERPTNPLQIGPALQMAAVFQIVLFAVNIVRRYFGDSGLLVSGAVLGLTDVDALTISMSKVATSNGSAAIAAEAIAVGIAANCVMKAALATTLGVASFARQAALAVGAMAVAIALSLVLIR